MVLRLKVGKLIDLRLFLCYNSKNKKYFMHNHHHGKHHNHKKHSDDTIYNLEDHKLSVIFLDDISPGVKGEIEKSNFSRGHGGQNVNKSNQGVHLTFTPEGDEEKILASCMDERSEVQNYERALKSLIEKIRSKYILKLRKK